MELDLSKDVYIIEGPVVESPEGRLTVRTVDSTGQSIDFDPQSALAHFKGQEVRLVVVPLLTVEKLEAMARQLEGDHD